MPLPAVTELSDEEPQEPIKPKAKAKTKLEPKPKPVPTVAEKVLPQKRTAPESEKSAKPAEPAKQAVLKRPAAKAKATSKATPKPQPQNTKPKSQGKAYKCLYKRNGVWGIKRDGTQMVTARSPGPGKYS